MTNFGLAGSFLRFRKSQNNFKEVITRFKKYVYFPRYSGVRTLQVRDSPFSSDVYLVDEISLRLILNGFILLASVHTIARV